MKPQAFEANSPEVAPLDYASASFEYAPVSLWIEDYSGAKALLYRWRASAAGDMRGFLRADPSRLVMLAASVKVIAVNRRTLTMFEADDQASLIDNFSLVLREDMLAGYAEEMVQLWEGGRSFTGQSVNYTLGGKRMDIEIRGTILPGHEEDWSRVLVVIDDVTKREEARRALAARTAYADGLFEHSPVSLWVHDFSGIKTLLDDLKQRGISDFSVFTDVHPEFIERCMQEIRVINVNRRTLELFQGESKEALLARLDEVFRDDMRGPFRDQLLDLWNGKLFQLREVINYRLDGETLHLLMQFSVLPGHEHDWKLVQVALTDITARKKAEAYLEYLGTHDVLTQLHNRTYYRDELARLQRRRLTQVTVLMIDVNGLKSINDQLGHNAGDAMLRRAGEVLLQAVEKPSAVARIGGDEFAVLMPGADEDAGAKLVDEINRLVALNNQVYAPVALELSIGVAASLPGELLELTIKRADQELLDAKRRHYAQDGRSRRRD